MKVWSSYVAIGDSFTEGLSDEDPTRPGAYVGWADRLAGWLAEQATEAGRDFGYANLAVRGRKLDDIVGRQLDSALALRPELLSIVGGGNDILRPRADVDDLAARLEGAVAQARAAGSDVLLVTPVDPREAPVIRHTRGRIATYTAHIHSIARQHGAFVADQWGMHALRDWRMWAEDRLHMTGEGHRRVALAAFTALGFAPEDADWAAPLPPAGAAGRVETLRGNAAWAREHLGPWVLRRLRGRSSGDLVEPKRSALLPVESRTRRG
ncbi:MAG TPA: SGNH/GDSL hydrolase family protein [Nocardioidaceae bacterium]|nr:SGNH/GDSL hydrolase family protein [Nocardioidaceae bacterium]